MHPSEDSYRVAQRRAINAVRIFRGTHPDAVYLSKEIRGLCIPHERRIADIIKVGAHAYARCSNHCKAQSHRAKLQCMLAIDMVCQSSCPVMYGIAAGFGQMRNHTAISMHVCASSTARWCFLPLRAGAVVQYVPLFYRVQRPLLRGAVADRDSIARLRNLLLDFHSACYELKRDQQALSILLAAMQRQGLPENLSRDALKQLEVSSTCHPLHLSIACCAWLYLN